MGEIGTRWTVFCGDDMLWSVEPAEAQSDNEVFPTEAAALQYAIDCLDQRLDLARKTRHRLAQRLRRINRSAGRAALASGEKGESHGQG